MKLFTGIVISMALAHPALAQEAGTDASTMTCAEFVALDTAGRTSAMASIQAAAVAAAAAIKKGTGADTAVDDPTVDSDAAGGSDPATAGAAAKADPAAGGSGDMAATLLDACSSVPDMRVTDAMMRAEADSGSEGDAGATEGDTSGG